MTIIHNAAIVYLSFTLAGLFAGIFSDVISKEDVMQKLFLIIFITFLINVMCINGISEIAWYVVAIFLLFPLLMSMVVLFPIVNKMISKTPEPKRKLNKPK